MTIRIDDEQDSIDQRLEAWHEIAEHPFFAECYNNEGTLLAAMIEKLDKVHEYLVAVDQYDDHPSEDSDW